MEYPHCDSCICNLFCYRKKVFIQSVSNGDHDGISLSGMCGLTRAMFMVLRGDFAGAWKMHPFIYGVIILVGWFGMRRYIQRKETKSLWKMGDSSVRRTDSILCVPNGKVFFREMLR